MTHDFAAYGRLGGLKGGKATGGIKAQAARINGKKGGKPKSKNDNSNHNQRD